MSIYRAQDAEGFYIPHTEDEQATIVHEIPLEIFTMTGTAHSGDPMEWTKIIKHTFRPFMLTADDEMHVICAPVEKILAPSGCKHRECAMILEFGLN